MSEPRILLAVCAALAVGLLGQKSAAEAPSLDAAVGRVRESLEHVGQADRAVDSAQGGYRRALERAKVFFDHAERIVNEEVEADEDGEALPRQLALGMKELLKGIEEAAGHLETAGEELDEAARQREEADAALAEQMRTVTGNARKVREELDQLRREVRQQWEHATSQALDERREDRTAARAQVEKLMSKAAGEWQVLRTEEARLRFARDRRARLGQAARRIARRRSEIEELKKTMAAFRGSLLNPLAHPPAPKPLDSVEWPSPLRGELTVIDEKFAPPRPYQVPSGWTLRDRVRRFTRGGAP